MKADRSQWTTSRTRVLSIERYVPKLSFIQRWLICIYHSCSPFLVCYVASPSGTSFAPANVAMGSVLCRRSPNLLIIFRTSPLTPKRQEVSEECSCFRFSSSWLRSWLRSFMSISGFIRSGREKRLDLCTVSAAPCHR